MSDPRRIAITGASAGLGAALAQALAAPGVRLHLCARGAERLDTVAAACRVKGADVASATVDLQDPRAGPAWIGQIEAEGPLDMLILNAGTFAGRPEATAMEPLAGVVGMVATNLTAPVLCATRAAPAMRARGRGQIVLISSLAGRSPLPDAPTYSATKAGLSAFGKALADDLAGTGVSVHVVEPGHIHTHQTEQQRGSLPLAVSAQTAAARILAAVARGRGRIAFPWPADLYVRLTDALPRRLRLLIGRNQRFTVRNDPEGG